MTWTRPRQAAPGAAEVLGVAEPHARLHRDVLRDRRALRAFASAAPDRRRERPERWGGREGGWAWGQLSGLCSDGLGVLAP